MADKIRHEYELQTIGFAPPAKRLLGRGNELFRTDHWLLLESDWYCSHTKPITWRVC
jgi:hypothetical protein